MDQSTDTLQMGTLVEPLGISGVRELIEMEIPDEETMLIRYSCKDMGLDCPFVVKGETVEEVIKKALAHVREKHVDDFNSIQSPEEIERMELALTRSTKVVAG